VTASSGWGRFEPDVPSGFRAVTEQDLGEDGISFALSERWRSLAPVTAWLLDREDGTPYFSVVEVQRHAARPSKAESLFHYAARAHGDFQEGEVTPEIDDESLARWFNRVATIRDERGREIVEWSYVMKGCERTEVFERFVEDGDNLFHVSVVVEPTIAETELADWLARFFDAPFAAPAAANRASLTGEKSPR
jgi:hypothetical protein